MKHTLIAVIFSSLLITSEGTRAEGSHSYSFGFGYSNSAGHGSRHGYGGKHGMRYWNQHGSGHQFGHGFKYGHGNRYGNRHGNHRNYRHNPGSSFGYNYRYHGGYGNNGEIAGALLLGGVIGYGLNSVRQHYSSRTYYSNYYRDSYHLNSRDIVYPGSRRAPVPTASVGRRLYKDRNGDCSEIVRNSFGDELRIQLDRSECDW